jgi:outer membrane lipoprotein SlyB
MKTFVRSTLALLALSALGACAQTVPLGQAYGGEDWRYPQPGATYGGTANVAYGVVSAIEPGRKAEVNGGAGALLGGAIGAVIGRQVAGRGDARTAGTFAGAVAGALIGHHIEKRQASRAGTPARISVQLDRGGVITLEDADIGDLRVGERVRIENNRLVRVARAPAAVEWQPT